MKKQYFILVLSLIMSVSSHAQVTPFIAGRLQHTLDSVCARYNVKGASAAAYIPGMGLWKGVSGVSYEGQPMHTDMLLGMGSNTKTHIAAVLLRMQDDSLIDLDDTIGTWIQGYPNINGQITIRQCLNHTSGLHDYMQNPGINDSILTLDNKQWTKPEILKMALAPTSAPGATWDYSNTNYIIAGIIIESVMQKPAYQVLKEMILDPHDLNQTTDFATLSSGSYAHPWSVVMSDGFLMDMTQTPYLSSLFTLASTAGSLMTTAEDNARFWYKLGSGQLLSENAWKEMKQLVPISSRVSYGLGIFLYSKQMNGRTFYSHGGTFFGYINENMYDTTTGVSIAVLTNQDSMSNDGLLSLLIKPLHKVTMNMPNTGLREELPSMKRTFYPNPATTEIVYDSETALESGRIQLVDLQGKVHKERVTTAASGTVDVADIPEGLYLIQSFDKEGTRIGVQRLVISR